MASVASPVHRGKPLTTNTRIAMVSALRCLFRDLRRWKLVGPLQIDVPQDLAVPKPLAVLRRPNPARYPPGRLDEARLGKSESDG